MRYRTLGIIHRALTAGVAAAGLALSLAACSSHSPAASPISTATVRPTPTGPAITSAPPATTAPAATHGPAPASPTVVPMQTAAGGEFFSPSGNISCEIDYHRAGLTAAYCQTLTPPQSVKMDVTGSYKTCMGEQCLGNPATGTPTLAYGEATGVGPFLCTSAAIGVTCTAAGRGFTISRSGITPE
jgi:hypothetical protein